MIGQEAGWQWALQPYLVRVRTVMNACVRKPEFKSTWNVIMSIQH
jgi:hypothetical protein